MSKNVDKTKAQLEAENKMLRAQIDRIGVGDTLRFEGEEWFRLVEYFDAEDIKRVPTVVEGIDNAYLMGYVEDVLVVQVPRTTTTESFRQLHHALKRMGVKTPMFTITDDMTFLKLARATPERSAELDKAAVKELEDAVAARAEAARLLLTEGKVDVKAEAQGPESGRCPDCDEEGYSADQGHGCVYCGLGRKRSHDDRARPESTGDGVGGIDVGHAGDLGAGGDSDGEGEAV